MNNIQAQPGWKIHTPNDGSNIGGAQPTNWGWFQGPPLGPTQAMLYVEGSSWATVESYFLAPLPASGQYALSFDLIVDAVSLSMLQNIEIDIIHCLPTTRLNMSQQRRRDLGDMVQVAGQEPNDPNQPPAPWISTGFQLPVVANTPMRQTIFYGVGTKTFGVQAMQSAGLIQLVRPELQQLTPIDSNWTPGALIQLQITLVKLPPGTASAKASIIFDNMTLV